jgi:hypothetical protein
MGVAHTAEASAQLVGPLDAAYRFDHSLWDLALNSKYDFIEHASDWIDVQQLYYLSDDQMHFVTNDSKHIGSTRGSSQHGRILSYQDLFQRVNNGNM